MKTLFLLVAAFLIPAFLFGQGVASKQSNFQSSNSDSKSQSYQGSTQNSGSYQPKQTYQAPQQNSQPQNQQNSNVNQGNSQMQNGYTRYEKYQNPNTYSASTKLLKSGSVEESGLTRLSKPQYSGKKQGERKEIRLSTVEALAGKRVKQKAIILFNTVPDSNSGLHVGEILTEKYTVAQSYAPNSPEVVYKLTPTLRLCYVSGNFNGWPDLNGYGVHVAVFLNFNYCVNVANWIRKKYHAISYVFKEENGYPHYHLVFGRWITYKSAEIFEGKVRKEAPHAFICRWRSDFSVLFPNGKIQRDYYLDR